MVYEINDFVCERCGNCCRGEGIVRVAPEEARAIAQWLGMPLDAFYVRYTRQPDDPADAAHGVRWLVDRPGPAHACVFLEEGGCRIYPVRPARCRTFPLAWRTAEMLRRCGGMAS